MLKLLFLMSVSAIYIVNGFPGSASESLENHSDPERNQRTVDISENGPLLHRYKRGWGALFFTGASILVRVTSLGLTLGAALSEGCSFYPSICSDKDEIERLDNLIKGSVSQYEQMYVESKQTYYDLKTATTNNAYISYYVNHTMQIVETLQELEDSLVTELELKLPTLSSINNLTFEQYLNVVLGQLEYRLADLQKMLSAQKQNALLGLAVQYLVETTVSRFAKSFQNAYNTVSNEDIIATTYADLWERMEGADLEVGTKPGLKQKLKLVPRAFKQMARNFGQSLKDFGSSVKKWGRIRNWKGFKGKLAHTFRKPLAKLSAVKQFITNPTVRNKFVNNYKITWSQGIMTGIGILGDAIQQFVSIKEWSNVAKEMKKSRESYQLYYENLQKNLTELMEEKNNTTMLWRDTLDIFKNITLPFKTLMINASEYSNFSDVIGLAKLPVDKSSPLFTIDFDNLNKTSLKSNQLSVIAFLKNVDNNMTVIKDEMRSRVILYNNTLSKSENGEPVNDILDDMKSILRFFPSITIKNYGIQLELDNIVCTVSILRTDISEYDYFPLEPFRPRCDVNSSTFAAYNVEALLHRKSKLMRKIVIKTVNESADESLTQLVDAVHNAYLGVSDQEISAFGSSITDKDVICLIAEEFPSKQTYDYIRLASFRPDCSTVTSETFATLLSDAIKLRELTTAVETSLKTCKDYNFCPCLSQVASQNGVNEEDVENALKQLDPNWQPNPTAAFCGPTGCGCNHL